MTKVSLSSNLRGAPRTSVRASEWLDRAMINAIIYRKRKSAFHLQYGHLANNIRISKKVLANDTKEYDLSNDFIWLPSCQYHASWYILVSESDNNLQWSLHFFFRLTPGFLESFSFQISFHFALTSSLHSLYFVDQTDARLRETMRWIQNAPRPTKSNYAEPPKISREVASVRALLFTFSLGSLQI